MHRLLVLSLLALGCANVQADSRASCEAAAGVLRTGTVVQGPRFTHGQFRRGIELSHTHLKVRADQDGQVYDVAIDNAFARDFDAQQAAVPPSLGAIRVNDRVEMCGALYSRGVGIHFVHTNCGERASVAHPDGWLRVLTSNGQPGANLESNTAWCPLFAKSARHHGRSGR